LLLIVVQVSAVSSLSANNDVKARSVGEDCDAGARARKVDLYSNSPFPDQSDEFL
jgi:hypothetical protein